MEKLSLLRSQTTDQHSRPSLKNQKELSHPTLCDGRPKTTTTTANEEIIFLTEHFVANRVAGKLERDNTLIYNTIIMYNLNERLMDTSDSLFLYTFLALNTKLIDNSTVLLSTPN